MPFPIGQNLSQFSGAFAPQRSEGNFQQAVQRLGQNQAQTQNFNPNQNQAGDGMVCFSPEAMQELAQSQASNGTQAVQGGAGGPQQLESQIQSGDLQGALETISELDARHPAQSNDPNAQLKSQLKQQLQNGDQQGAEATLEQIKANRPSGPPPQQH